MNAPPEIGDFELVVHAQEQVLWFDIPATTKSLEENVAFSRRSCQNELMSIDLPQMHTGKFYLPMNDTLCVTIGQGFNHLVHESRSFRLFEAPLRFALDILE